MNIFLTESRVEEPKLMVGADFFVEKTCLPDELPMVYCPEHTQLTSESQLRTRMDASFQDFGLGHLKCVWHDMSGTDTYALIYRDVTDRSVRNMLLCYSNEGAAAQ